MIFNLEQPIRPNKKISVFRVTGLKILGRVGRHTLLFFNIFFLEKNYNFSYLALLHKMILPLAVLLIYCENLLA